jgi:hypothetical protein
MSSVASDLSSIADEVFSATSTFLEAVTATFTGIS